MQTIEQAVRRGAARHRLVRHGVMAWCALVLALVAPGRADAQAPSAHEAVPAYWVSYAQDVGARFQASLAGGGDEALRLQQALARRAGPAGGAAGEPVVPPSVVVRTWIGRDGAITHVEFDPLDDVLAEASLEHLLTAVTLPPPPANMLQPLRVRLQLVPNPEAPAAASEAR
ncbi:YbaB/EbfC family DNA-binding protein [Burkholderia sp. 3C]